MHCSESIIATLLKEFAPSGLELRNTGRRTDWIQAFKIVLSLLFGL
jgi:hypothetical protein